MKTAEEMLGRMEAFVRKLHAETSEGDGGFVADMANSECDNELKEELFAIVAELPAPVDPDLLYVRQTVGHAVPRMMSGDKNILNGDYDDELSVQVPLACLKRGRELEREGR